MQAENITPIPIPKHRNFQDLTGQEFGHLSVIAFAGRENRITKWWCRCSCGTVAAFRSSNLRSKDSTSCWECGHRRTAQAKVRHGQSCDGGTSPEYNTWAGMIQRCLNPKSAAYYRYGGRGITVCERWRSFEKFFADMGERPSLEHTLDRIDNDGNYEPSNCRWATKKEQNRNTRTNRMVEVQGKTMCLAEAAESASKPYHAVKLRLRRGWSPEQALFTPLKSQGNK